MKSRLLLPGIFFFWFIAGPALAASPATFSFEGPSAPVKTGTTFAVALDLSDTTAPVNAVQGTITYPSDALKLIDIGDGGSIVNFWLEKPTATPPALHFSGIMPGGFLSDHGRVLTLRFLAEHDGAGAVGLDDSQALLNDGAGTPAAVTVQPLSLRVSVNGTVAPDLAADTTPPEPFSITVTSSPNLFGGAPFAVFATQDKESGIDHYEVQEGSGSFTPATSPYQLHDPHATSLTVRAYDHAGNVREATWSAPTAATSTVYAGLGIRDILLTGFFIVIVIVLGLWWYRHRRS